MKRYSWCAKAVLKYWIGSSLKMSRNILEICTTPIDQRASRLVCDVSVLAMNNYYCHQGKKKPAKSHWQLS